MRKEDSGALGKEGKKGNMKSPTVRQIWTVTKPIRIDVTSKLYEYLAIVRHNGTRYGSEKETILHDITAAHNITEIYLSEINPRRIWAGRVARSGNFATVSFRPRRCMRRRA